MRSEDERTYASELLRKLKEHGWLDNYRDPIDLKPTLMRSRAGKAFSETFANLDDARGKTRQRNMRSACKALAAFVATCDTDELLDAHEFDTVPALEGQLRTQADTHLRQRAPWLEAEVQGRSPLLWLADYIEMHGRSRLQPQAADAALGDEQRRAPLRRLAGRLLASCVLCSPSDSASRPP